MYHRCPRCGHTWWVREEGHRQEALAVRAFRAVQYYIRRGIPNSTLGGTFRFNGKEYEYFCHEYNSTGRNERSIEIPIIWDYVQSCKGRILEVGNVLPHYFPTTHDVIDKAEAWPGVVNEDAAEFRAREPYDLIVSISTLEHVGFDEPNPQPGKMLRALDSLVDNTKPGGRIVATIPLDYNPEADEIIRKGERFDEARFMRRAKRGWVEASREEALAAEYDYKGGSATAVMFGTIRVGAGHRGGPLA